MLTIRTHLQPGDIGALISLHGRVYGQEYGFDLDFELFVADTILQVRDKLNTRDLRLWLLEGAGEVLGAIAILRHDPLVGQLRWFVLDPRVRGQGYGRKLMDHAMAYCQAHGLQEVFLETVSGLDAAAYLYTRAGFCRVSAQPVRRWGQSLTLERHIWYANQGNSL